MAEVSIVKLLSDKCHWTLLMISQHWFRQWLGAVRQQAITWANVDPDLWRQMASLGHNELKRHHLTGIGIPTVNLRQSDKFLGLSWGIPMPMRRCFLSEERPRIPSLSMGQSYECPGLNKSGNFHLPDFQNCAFLNTDSIDGLVQDCCISIGNALEILQSCTKPEVYDIEGSFTQIHLPDWQFYLPRAIGLFRALVPVLATVPVPVQQS